MKKYKNGFITDPACLSPTSKIAEVDKLKEAYGYSGIPVTIDGKMGSKLVGIVTSRDIDFIEDRNIMLKDVMTTDLVTGNRVVDTNLCSYFAGITIFLSSSILLLLFLSAQEGVSLTEANEVLRRSKKGKLPVVNTAGEIVALISRTGVIPDVISTMREDVGLSLGLVIEHGMSSDLRPVTPPTSTSPQLSSDIKKAREFPDASKDRNKQLLVGAAIGTRENDKER